MKLMEGSRKYLILLFVLLTFGAWLWWSSREGSVEEEIRRLIGEAQEAVADRHIGRLLEQLHPEYRHSSGEGKKELQAALLGFVPPVGKEKVSLLYSEVRVSPHIDDAEVELKGLLVVGSRRYESVPETRPIGRVDGFHVVLKYRRFEGEWRVFRSSGRELSYAEFGRLMESSSE
ncbi:MAG: hypothetical protein QF752_06895 [Planctomycetota bacterium]|jgi:hypothetical protein|nr:hypothetical protein [Planctomycetota bacterium]